MGQFDTERFQRIDPSQSGLACYLTTMRLQGRRAILRTTVIVIAGLLILVGGGALYLIAQDEDRASVRPADNLPENDMASMLMALPADGFSAPAPDWVLDLPADHRPHPDARMESWQVTAHLKTAEGDALGFQFAVLRLGVVPPTGSAPQSVWEVRDVFRAHVGLVAAQDGSSRSEERFARGMSRLAGYDPDTDELRLDNWSFRFSNAVDDVQSTLRATLDTGETVELTIRPGKDPIALEPNGAEAPIAGYTFSRLDVSGTILRGDQMDRVTGTAWFDHTWGELPVPGAGPVSWDRVLFQLSDGTDGTIVRSRRTDGRGAASVNGVLIDKSGDALTLEDDNMRMIATRSWRHAPSGAEYPLEWQLVGSDLDVTVTPLTDAQRHAFAIPMWSGVVKVAGRHRGIEITGMGTLQLTGYEPR